MNALKRLVDGNQEYEARLTQELELARQQQIDYEARIGNPFPFAEQTEQLTALRNQLKRALSDKPSTEDEAPLPPTSEITDAIKQLLEQAHDSPQAERSTTSQSQVLELPITQRLRERLAHRSQADDSRVSEPDSEMTIAHLHRTRERHSHHHERVHPLAS